MTKLLSILLLLICSFICSSGCYSQGTKGITSKIKLSAPSFGIYHGAFPDMGPTEDVVTTERIKSYNKLTGKDIAWVYFSNNWFKGIRFPAKEVDEITTAGSMPFIRMMPRSDFIEGAQDPVYTMQGIVDGKHDNDLRQWARDARDKGVPLMIEFGTEANGDWFSWGGAINGGGTINGYGDPTYPDGPERFRDAYRHIIDLFEEEKAHNITWAFHMNAGSSPEADWNKMSYYYPGDEYIDWLGMSIYGGQVPGEDWDTFVSQLQTGYTELSTVSLTKPLAVFEFGVIEDPSNGDKAAWIKAAFDAVTSGDFPRIKGISYWHSTWTNDDGRQSIMRLDSNEEVVKTYRAAISNPIFISKAEYLR